MFLLNLATRRLDAASSPRYAAIRPQWDQPTEHIGLVIFGHDTEQWETLKKAPEFYE